MNRKLSLLTFLLLAGISVVLVIVFTLAGPTMLSVFAQPTAGSIAGHVYESDGVTPIVSAWVYAMDTQFNFVGGTNSLTDGSYQIDALPTGNYYIAVSESGYGGVYYDNGYDDPHATLVNVTAPNDTPDIDFQLSPEATVSGYIYEADGTTPINGASVQVWPVHGGQIRSATSDATGSYTVGGLSTGDYVAKVEATGYAVEYYNNATSSGTATSISIAQPNNASGIDFTLDPGGSILGHIYEEDGVTPIAGADVWAAGPDAEYIHHTNSQADGSYTIGGLPSDTYKVKAIADNFAWEWYQGKSSHQEADTIVVTAPGDTSGIDFVMHPGGAIRGTVLAEGGGVITDVQLNVGAGTGTGVWQSALVSQIDGTYEISGLPAGQYRVEANLFTLGYDRKYYDNVYRWDQASLVTISGENTVSNIDFSLGPGGGISGHVYAEDGVTPIANVCVNVSSTAPDFNQVVGWGRTGSDGSFSFGGVPVGDMYIRTDTRCSGQSVGYIDEWYASGGSIPDGNDATAVQIVADQFTNNINFNLEPGGGISGHVYESDGVTPIEGADVWAAGPDAGYVHHTNSQVDGSYTITSLPSNTYTVKAHKDGYVWEWYNQQTSHWDADSVAVTVPNNTQNIDFTLDPASSGTISGHIFKADGSTVITDVQLYVGAETGTGILYTAPVSQIDGSYEIADVQDGEYRVIANHSNSLGYERKFYDNVYRWDLATSIIITGGNTVSDIDFVLGPGGGIAGYVYADDGVTPVEGVCVNVSSTAPEFNQVAGWGRTSSTGSFSFGGVPVGNVYIRTDTNCSGQNVGYIDEWYADGGSVIDGNDATAVQIVADQFTNNINFTLDSAGSISGAIYNADGITPIVSAWVYAMDTHFDFIGSTHSQADGSYEINALGTGSYYVAVSASGYGGVYYDSGYDGPHAILVNVTAPNDTPDIDFQLSPEATVSGYVYETDGTTPINGASVQVWPAHGGQIRSATTDISGGYTVGGLSTGDYVAKAVANDYFDEYYDNATSWGTATSISVMQPNDTSGIDFTLQQIGIITSSIIVSDTTNTITATTDITTALSFPLGAVSQPITVTIGLTTSQPISSGFRFLGHNFTIEATTATGTLVTTFLKPFTITIHYDDADVEGIDEASLKLHYWDSSTEQWEEIQTTVDIDTNIITAVLDHLTTFAVLGSESEKLKVYLPVILK